MSFTERVFLLIMGIPKSLYLNFKSLPFRDAIKLPILISKNVKMVRVNKILIQGPVSTGMIKIGFGDIGIFDGVHSRSIIKNTGTIIFQGKASLGHGVKLNVNRNAVLVIGDGVVFSGESAVVCSEEIVLGDGCLISWDVLIMDTDFHQVYECQNDGIQKKPKEKSRKIYIGKSVWVGCRCLIMKGINIEDGCIISAGTKLYKSINKKGVIVGGDGNDILKENIQWKH